MTRASVEHCSEHCYRALPRTYVRTNALTESLGRLPEITLAYVTRGRTYGFIFGQDTTNGATR